MSHNDPENIKARTDKAELPPKVRAILEEEGVVKPPALPNPAMPKVDQLIAAGKQQGLGFELHVPEPDDEAEPEDQVATATFFEVAGSEGYAGEDAHPAVAAAIALAKWFETRPRQAPLGFKEAAD